MKQRSGCSGERAEPRGEGEAQQGEDRGRKELSGERRTERKRK